MEKGEDHDVSSVVASQEAAWIEMRENNEAVECELKIKGIGEGPGGGAGGWKRVRWTKTTKEQCEKGSNHRLN